MHKKVYIKRVLTTTELAGDAHPNPGTIKREFPVCSLNVECFWKTK